LDGIDLTPRGGASPRILLTRLRYLGDIILTTPVIDALGECFPGSEIWYMAEPPHSSVLERHPGLAGIIETGGRGGAGTLATVMRLRKLRFAAAVDLFYNPRSANILWLSGIPVRIGGGRRWRRRLYTHIFRPGRGISDAISHHLEAARALGCEGKKRRPRIYLGEDELARGRERVADAFRGSVPDRLIAMMPGGTWPAKRWPPGSFAALAEGLEHGSGVGTLIISGPGQEEISRTVESMTGSAPAVLPPLPVREAASAVAACGALVSNDGGLMHAGVALGVPTVGIFGPTDTDMWFPYGGMGPFEVVSGGAECSPCDLHECGDMRCLKDIGPGEVISALGRVTGWKL
jgi:ADP-heptose:LPS heptosyltransferase